MNFDVSFTVPQVLERCVAIKIKSDGRIIYVHEDGEGYFDEIIVFGDGDWMNSWYRTITLDEPATGDFLTWLEANAVKQ